MANEPLGFIGLGIMGGRMAANLARAGYDVRVWNRTRETADAWAAEHGGTVADSPRAASVDVRFETMPRSCCQDSLD